MTIVNGIIIALLIILLAQKLIPVKGIKQMTTAQLKNELKDKSKQYIDVRTLAEFKGFHVPGFVNMPLHQLHQKMGQLSKDKEVVVICQSGMRSSKASKMLKNAGFKNITNIKGGVSAWR
ncbi:rhodanese-like domain-containing protein [Aeromicrobium ponti]|uniref:Rhodanese-related sulfurtransferase n=1 Tax=Cytobacillus oceanisediminis TaxID=665099 RepID=A0A562JP74_9BACI|nr:rhodanese-like domain-containing protein [Cytobacillus oceanisediminis]TWH84970.1 rhodanese-related sulfurtransferase [Cytobacillus oceanisediminis]